MVVQILEAIQWHGPLCAVEEVPLAIPLERHQSIGPEVIGFPWGGRLVQFQQSSSRWQRVQQRLVCVPIVGER